MGSEGHASVGPSPEDGYVVYANSESDSDDSETCIPKNSNNEKKESDVMDSDNAAPSVFGELS